MSTSSFKRIEHDDSTQPVLRRSGLPVQIAPITAETLVSYLQRLTDRNLLRPQWLSELSHQPHFGTTLAQLTGLSEKHLASALPELRSTGTVQMWPHLIGQVSAGAGSRPACTHCAAARTGDRTTLVTVFACHEQLICHSHRRWIGCPDLKCTPTAQFSLQHCPDIVTANRQHQRLIKQWGRGPVRASFVAAVRCFSLWARWPVVIRAPDISTRWARLGITQQAQPLGPAEVAAWYPNAVAVTQIILSHRRHVLTAELTRPAIVASALTQLHEVIAGLSPGGAADPFRQAIFGELLEPGCEAEGQPPLAPDDFQPHRPHSGNEPPQV
ncbi:hypothetical protein [Mycobacteroides abscessus]|uniref:hypothetical protein n=1 Tax=Mycobacteroides abscessus TaxID=36809 RepID=UPI000C25D19D|nr:hypothetical protein [Mycobacteroides abscessus]